jgi:HPt (histidine-containing phosphotransfer) domain-containing protein
MSEAFDRGVLDHLRASLGDDTGVFAQRLIATFQRQGWEMLPQLEQAARDHDVPGVAAVAHKLKGSSGSVGGQQLVLLCDELEHWQGSGDQLAGKVATVREELRLLDEELTGYR